MTSGTEGGDASTGTDAGRDDVTLDSVDAGPSNPPSRRWWFAAVLAIVAAGTVAAIVWQTGSGDEPTALVTITDPTVTDPIDPTATEPPSTTATTTNAGPLVPGSTSATDAPTMPDDERAGPTTVQRPIVPASTASSTSTVAPPSTILVSGSVSGPVSGPVSGSVSGSVSDSADPTAPRVSLVDDAVTEAIVIEPVPNTALDGAARTPGTVTSTTTRPPLACDATPSRLDVDTLVAAGAVTGENADGSAATLVVSDLGLGIAGGRVADMIDYSARRGGSERVFIDLGTARCAVQIDVDAFDTAEWNGVDESLHWVGLDGENRTVAEGFVGAASERPIALDLAAPIERLLLEASPYGATAAGWPDGADRRTEDNSDFVLVAVIVR